MYNNVNQNVSGNNNSTSLNIAGGNIASNTAVSPKEVEDINELLDKLKHIISQDELKEFGADIVLDDIDTIQEQIKSENPKKIRLKSALDRIKSFATKIPKTVAFFKVIVDNISEIHDKVQPIIENLVH